MISRRLTASVLTVLYFEQVYSQCVIQNDTMMCVEISELPRDFAEGKGGEDLRTVTDIEVKSPGNRTRDLLVHTNSFSLTPNLKSLRIYKYSVGRLTRDTFSNSSVERIYLKYDDIDYIYSKTFTNLSKVKTIYLDNNLLKAIPKGIFGNLPELIELSFSNNEITFIETAALENLPKLRKLRLDHNKIESIFLHQTISHPEKLEILWLQNNSLNSVTNFMLRKLMTLKLLNLGFNRISFIEPSSFEHTPNLDTLVLTHNSLKTVDGDIFPRTGMTSLRNLYLDNNHLMFISSNFFFRLNGLRKITLVGNPWFCPCLDIIERILHENSILQQCQGVYSTGERPFCVIENDTSNCNHRYNNVLSDKYINYLAANPVYTRPIDCVL